MRRLSTCVLVLLAASLASGEGTNLWQQSKFEDFEKGTAKGVAIRSDGTLQPAPAFKLLFTSPSTYIWALATDSRGNVYAATGSPARVYRVTPEGEASIIFEPKEFQVQALAVDERNTIYAATSPDGKVYKIEKLPGKPPAPGVKRVDEADRLKANNGAEEKGRKASSDSQAAAAMDKTVVPVDPSYSSSVFFDPKTKYIWALAIDRGGSVYVATGDRGEIFRVSAGGQGSLFFKSDETHIRALKFDQKNNLIAGSDGSGLIYRITPRGEGFVLYSTQKKEITALESDSNGTIYAAGVGEKRVAGAAAASFAGGQPSVSLSAAGVTVGGVSPAQASFGSTPGTGTGSDIYAIDPDGSPRRLWSSHEELVYTLAGNRRGLLVGTGNRGRIFLVQDEGSFSDYIKASASQVTAFARAFAGQESAGPLYVGTSNLGKIFKLQNGFDGKGTFESDVFDAKVFSRWGRAQVRGEGNFEIYLRSGNVENPDRNWSPWKKLDLVSAAAVPIPPARFVQWKAILRSEAARLQSVVLYYRPKNLAPAVDEVVVQVGARFQAFPHAASDVIMVGVGSAPGAAPVVQPHFETPLPAQRDRQSIAIRWSAHDDNEDDLVYTLYYRGDGESRWKLLKDKITDKFYTWDSGVLPDGGYIVKVVSSDAPSRSPEDSLSGEKESGRFEVDNTPPRIEALKAEIAGNRLHVSFRAEDAFSPIKKAEYSVDGSDWQFVEPVGLLSDSLTENYDFRVPLHRSPAQPTETAEYLVVVRVYDRFDNISSAKVVLK